MFNLNNIVGSTATDLSSSFNSVAPNLPRALIVLVVGFILIKVALIPISKLAINHTRWPEGLQEILETVVRLAFWGLLAIIFLQVLGLSSAALALTGTFAVLAIGLSQGLSSLVSDLVAGLQIANDKDFRVGYKVRVGDKQTEGIIREIDIKKTRVEDHDGHLHVIPNSVIEKNEWTVLMRHVHSKMPESVGIIKSAQHKASARRHKK